MKFKISKGDIMGLDNGIVIRTKKTKEMRDIVPWYVSVASGEWVDKFNFEVCYWRKCWNIRAGIFDILWKNHHNEWHKSGYDESPKEQMILRIEDVKEIYQLLVDYINEDLEWDTSDTIWELKDYRPYLVQCAMNLIWLVEWMTAHPEDVVEFYDSY